MSTHEEHLDLLGIFHYVVGGLAAAFACFPVFHLIIGLVVLFAPVENEGPPEEMRYVFGGIFIIIPLLIILAGWAFAVCLLYAGRNIRARTRYTFCLVMAGLSCMFMPFGTVLGVLTIIMLMKPEVKAIFGVGPPPAAAAAPAPPGPPAPPATPATPAPRDDDAGPTKRAETGDVDRSGRRSP